MVVGLVLAALVLGGNWLLRHAKHAEDSGGTKPNADVEAPTQLTLGSLTFTECQLGAADSGATTAALCTPFQVPEDWSKPDGRKIDLKVAIIPSDAATVRPDLLMYLAGGPGESTTGTWPMVAPALEEARKHRNVLLVDQRGTGDSHPLTCPARNDIDEPGPDDLSPKHIQEVTRQCLQELERTTDVTRYTTEDAVKDMEAVRQALGAPKLDLVGISYGTRLAQRYAMRHPDGVRSLVLDGVVPNSLVLGSEFSANLEHALKARSELCEKTPACKKAFGNPYENLYALRDQLAAKPEKVSFRDPATFEPRETTLDGKDLAMLVRMFSYTTETAALIPVTVEQARHGHFAPLTGQLKLLSGDLSGLEENAMQISVICSEDVDALKANPASEKTLLGNHLVDLIKAQCEVWPHGTRAKDSREPLKGAIPTLLTSGEYDPVTPPRYGEEVLKGLSNARHLVVRGQGHSVVGRGCMPKLLAKFEDTLDPKALDAKCLDTQRATPAFIDLNGAAP
jgi:pimeloyl-ACP methyl ester carboxylesterase